MMISCKVEKVSSKGENGDWTHRKGSFQLLLEPVCAADVVDVSVPSINIKVIDTASTEVIRTVSWQELAKADNSARNREEPVLSVLAKFPSMAFRYYAVQGGRLKPMRFQLKLFHENEHSQAIDILRKHQCPVRAAAAVTAESPSSAQEHPTPARPVKRARTEVIRREKRKPPTRLPLVSQQTQPEPPEPEQPELALPSQDAPPVINPRESPLSVNLDSQDLSINVDAINELSFGIPVNQELKKSLLELLADNSFIELVTQVKLILDTL